MRPNPEIQGITPAPIFRIASDPSDLVVNFAVNLSSDGGIYATFSDDTVSMNANISINSWQFCTLTRSNGTTNFYTNGSNTYTDTTLYSTAYLGNNSNPVWFGEDGASYITNMLMTNFRWTTGYSDPSASYVPTTTLGTITGTTLLFTASDGPSMWKDAVFDTSMTVALNDVYNTPLGVWLGLTPFQITTVSWGSAHVRPPYQFVGFGVPTSDPSGSIQGIGDTYLDLSTGDVYDIV